jgi:hypothetical protein
MPRERPGAEASGCSHHRVTENVRAQLALTRSRSAAPAAPQVIQATGVGRLERLKHPLGHGVQTGLVPALPGQAAGAELLGELVQQPGPVGAHGRCRHGLERDSDEHLADRCGAGLTAGQVAAEAASL